MPEYENENEKEVGSETVCVSSDLDASLNLNDSTSSSMLLPHDGEEQIKASIGIANLETKRIQAGKTFSINIDMVKGEILDIMFTCRRYDVGFQHVFNSIDKRFDDMNSELEGKNEKKGLSETEIDSISSSIVEAPKFVLRSANGEFYTESGNCYQRVPAHIAPQVGQYHCNQTGTLTITWDNTYSYVRSKLVAWYCCITPPGHRRELSDM